MQTTVTAEQLQQKLSLIWEQCGGIVYQRIATLEDAAEAMALGTLSGDLEAQARSEAHAIQGELGTFGFQAAAAVALAIEALLSDPTRRSSSEVSLFYGLILMLRREMDEITTTAPRTGLLH